MIFEIGADGSPTFASETDAPVNRNLSLENANFGTFVAGGRILLPGPNSERLAVDPETGDWEEAISSFDTLRDGVLERPYGEDGILLLDVGIGGSSLIVSDGTPEGTVRVNEAIGLSSIDRATLFVSNDAIAFRATDGIYATADAFDGLVRVVDARAGAPDRPDGFSVLGILDGPDDLFDTLAARYGTADEESPGDDGTPGGSGDGDGGGAGNGRIQGTPGADRLDGTAADDVIVGLGGIDRVSGGSGADSFVLFGAGAPAGLVIEDFSGAAGEGDRLVIDDRYLGLGGGDFDLRSLNPREASRLLADGTASLRDGLLTFDPDGDGVAEAGALFRDGATLGLADVLIF
jgi:Ca2+-binding RTX toxin-like protein